MFQKPGQWVAALALLIFAAAAAANDSWVRTEAQPGDFPLVHAGRAATLVYSENDAKVVALATRDFAQDVERVTGAVPVVRACGPKDGTSQLAICARGHAEAGEHANDRDRALPLGRAAADSAKPATPAAPVSAQPLVLIGTVGRSDLIDTLVRAGKLNVDAVLGRWESFLISAVKDPVPGVSQALVIAGSDRRGTAFGVYELSQAIGISPWHFWADVPPRQRSKSLYVAAGERRFGPPSVQYRGIFINDEDWSLRPWASRTFEPENGNIGPKTYGRIFELLLRLKANTLWPAMHPGTTPFNGIAQNAQLADDYAIVMSSSHAEPMLRNNVGEWQIDPHQYNYVSNREGVRTYWEQRVRENARFENIYTLGMRGIHDSKMEGPKDDAERIRVLEQVFADQRAMLTAHVSPDVERTPQAFVAYKEVLGLYRQGLKVPEDVTIVWPDDNFGYIRNFATDAEQQRAGGFGVYYHLSYLGRPLSYLWLSTLPPALIWEEMTKAYDHGAHKLWIANVGDLKPAEAGTEFFLQLAWNIQLERDGFLERWAARELGPRHAKEIAAVMSEYYRLNFIRKPEHLQWWLPREAPRPSGLSKVETEQRLSAFKSLRARADKLYATIPAERRDALFQLVVYPVRGAALANERYFFGEQSALLSSTNSAESQRLAKRATQADAALTEQTRIYNEDIAKGKWRHFMALEPADGEWSSMRIAKWTLPRFEAKAGAMQNHGNARGSFTIDAGSFSAKVDRGAVGWKVIPGLGHTGRAVAVFPTTAASIEVAQAASSAPRLEYDVRITKPGDFTTEVQLVPTRPLRADRGLRLAVGLNDQAPQEIIVHIPDDSPEWAQAVLNNSITASVRLPVAAAGAHKLRVYMIDPGVVVDRITLEFAAAPRTQGP